MRYAYQAIAQYSGRDAGHVCYGRTSDEARARAHQQTDLSIRLRRVRVTPPHYAQIVAGDRAADSLTHRI